MSQTNQQWIERRNAAVARGVANAHLIMVPVTVSDAVPEEGLDIIDRSLLEIADTPSSAQPPLAAAR